MTSYETNLNHNSGSLQIEIESENKGVAKANLVATKSDVRAMDKAITLDDIFLRKIRDLAVVDRRLICT